ncbi:hypothetical protein PSMK_25810 [Phycisphaera mikurensis NBRC 102666]|uniref:Uncharacterized protein n=1 Tax=Phycisphaera mikurensis (strain NBRC 102666 / KCTC 22515 / FYK2301M01) TaxID=1142394 RepID=I0IHK2_PHYMF|nr:hypothetical protein PSMK_25810 [Phycisphaera mikurensis NBRC 102666]
MLLWSAATVRASAGTERYGDVTVSIGDADGPASFRGYVRHAVTLRNDGGVARRVTIRLPEHSYGGGDHLQSLSRTFSVEAGGTANAELLFPPLEVRGSGNAVVSIDGVRQRDAVPVSMRSGGHDAAPAGLLVSRTVDRETRSRLEAAKDAHNTAGGSPSTGGGFGGFGGGTDDVPLVTAEPIEQWSRSWLGYTGFSAVVVGENDLSRMPPSVAGGLRDWSLAGGQLVVVTDTEGERPMPPGWPRAAGSGDAAIGLGKVSWWGPEAPEREADAAAEAWIKDALAHGNAALRPLTAEQAERSFPVVEGLTTPVRGLVLLMLVFAVLIGPVNIGLLAYHKRRMWLLWTVPLGSAVFSVGVIAFAFLSEGVSPQARTQAVTYLDQTTREAVTIGMRGYYAPLTPGDGLRFPMSTRVVPQVVRQGWNDSGRGRSVDQTSGQHLTRGWVAARVPAHLELTDVSASRLRLDVEELPGGGIAVTNGLGVAVDNLRLASPKGQQFQLTGTLAPGAVETLAPAPAPSTHVAGGHVEMLRLRRWAAADLTFDDHPPAAGTYVANVASTPFVEDGLDGLAEHRIDVTILGRYAPATGGGG